MANEKEPAFLAHSKQQEPLFLLRVVFIEEFSGKIIQENGFCLFERHPVLQAVDTILFRSPSESDWTRTYIVTTLSQFRNRADGPIFGVQPDPAMVQTMDLEPSGGPSDGFTPSGP